MIISHSRNNCLVSGNEDLQTVKKINNFPIVMGCSSQSEKSDLLEDLIFSISKSTGFIQIKNLIDPTLLYSAINEYHGAGSVGSMWQRHHEEFSNFINLNNPSSVFEIGGGHGILSKIFESKHKLIDWTIIEPYPRPVEGVKAKFIKGFFDENFKFNLKYDLIVHSHTLEHIYDPKSFLIQLNNASKHGQIMAFSVPNMNKMLDNKYPNFMNFEHTTFLSEEFLDFIIKETGFQIEEKFYFEEHSIFYKVVKKQNAESKSTFLESQFENNLKRINNYFLFFEKKIELINDAISDKQENVFLFGAHIFGQLLLKLGLNEHKINNLLDNDVSKQNKRLYGTKLIVKSPKILEGLSNPFVILNAGIYNSEIKRQIINEINPSVNFFEIN